MDNENPGIPTRENIQRLALENPILHRVLSMHRAGVVTWEQMLEIAVQHLVARNAELMAIATDLTARQPPPALVWGTPSEEARRTGIGYPGGAMGPDNPSSLFYRGPGQDPEKD